MTVGQLCEIFMAEVKKEIKVSEDLMIQAIPAIVRYAERKERINPDRVMAIIDQLCLPLIPPTKN